MIYEFQYSNFFSRKIDFKFRLSMKVWGRNSIFEIKSKLFLSRCCYKSAARFFELKEIKSPFTVFLVTFWWKATKKVPTFFTFCFNWGIKINKNEKLLMIFQKKKNGENLLSIFLWFRDENSIVSVTNLVTCFEIILFATWGSFSLCDEFCVKYFVTFYLHFYFILHRMSMNNIVSHFFHKIYRFWYEKRGEKLFEKRGKTYWDYLIKIESKFI